MATKALQLSAGAMRVTSCPDVVKRESWAGVNHELQSPRRVLGKLIEHVEKQDPDEEYEGEVVSACPLLEAKEEEDGAEVFSAWQPNVH